MSMKVLLVRSFPDVLNLNTYNVQEIGLAKALRSTFYQTQASLQALSWKKERYRRIISV